MRPFKAGIYLKYSALEHVERIQDVKHPIIREALALQILRSRKLKSRRWRIFRGTGTRFVGQFHHRVVESLISTPAQAGSPARSSPNLRAKSKSIVSRNDRKTDQYIAAYGGLTCLRFTRSSRGPRNRCGSRPIRCSILKITAVVLTGYSRDAGTILQDQQQTVERA